MAMVEQQKIVQTQIDKDKEAEDLIDPDLCEEKDDKIKKKERDWDSHGHSS